ncbi:ERI1 exoribonuclease 2 isoform X2 [Aplysia californica]|nr:ERI1 exoribonuclease 2 isoform X2 [Aplysia californica]
MWLRRLREEKGIVCADDGTAGGDKCTSGQKVAALVTWSDWDLGVCLLYEAKRKQITRPSALNRWIDLRLTYRKFYQRRPDGLNGALQDLGLIFDGRQHSGVDDARNTARVAWRMICDGCQLLITKTLKTTPDGSMQRVSTPLSTQHTGSFHSSPAHQTVLEIHSMSKSSETKSCLFHIAEDVNSSLSSSKPVQEITRRPGLKMRDSNVSVCGTKRNEKDTGKLNPKVTLPSVSQCPNHQEEMRSAPRKNIPFTRILCNNQKGKKSKIPVLQVKGGEKSPLHSVEHRIVIPSSSVSRSGHSEMSDKSSCLGPPSTLKTPASCHSASGSSRLLSPCSVTSVSTSLSTPLLSISSSSFSTKASLSHIKATSEKFSPHQTAPTPVKFSPDHSAAVSTKHLTVNLSHFDPTKSDLSIVSDDACCGNQSSSDPSMSHTFPSRHLVPHEPPFTVNSESAFAVNCQALSHLSQNLQTPSCSSIQPHSCLLMACRSPHVLNRESAKATSCRTTPPVCTDKQTVSSVSNVDTVSLLCEPTASVLNGQTNEVIVSSQAVTVKSVTSNFTTPVCGGRIASHQTDSKSRGQTISRLTDQTTPVTNGISPPSRTNSGVRSHTHTSKVQLRMTSTTTTPTSFHDFSTPTCRTAPVCTVGSAMSAELNKSRLSATSMRATPPLCTCGRRSKRRLVQKQGPNTGRWFFSCSMSFANSNCPGRKSGCKFFQWETPSR